MFKYQVTLKARKGEVSFDSRFLTQEEGEALAYEALQFTENTLQRWRRLDCRDFAHDEDFDSITLTIRRRHF